jgi:hypothetical protein
VGILLFCIYIISVGVVYGLIREETRDDEIIWVALLWPLILFLVIFLFILAFLFRAGVLVAESILRKKVGDIL